MTNDFTPPTTRPVKPKRGIKPLDILIAIALAVIIGVLAMTLLKQLNVRQQTNDARATTDKLITAMQEQDGTAARLLGDENFRNKNSDTQLRALFADSKPYIAGTPTVTKQTINSGEYNTVVSVYYEFKDKKPFYVRVTAIRANDSKTWKVINFSGNPSLASLEK